MHARRPRARTNRDALSQRPVLPRARVSRTSLRAATDARVPARPGRAARRDARAMRGRWRCAWTVVSCTRSRCARSLQLPRRSHSSVARWGGAAPANPHAATALARARRLWRGGCARMRAMGPARTVVRPRMLARWGVQAVPLRSWMLVCSRGRSSRCARTLALTLALRMDGCAMHGRSRCNVRPCARSCGTRRFLRAGRGCLRGDGCARTGHPVGSPPADAAARSFARRLTLCARGRTCGHGRVRTLRRRSALHAHDGPARISCTSREAKSGIRAPFLMSLTTMADR